MNIGDKMPEFTLMGVDDKEHDNFDYADRYAIAIVFTCNTCPTSQEYWGRIHTMKSKYEEDNLILLCINSNDAVQSPDDSFAKMKEVAKSAGIYPHYLYDESQAVAKKFGATITPEVFLFNSKRELVYHGAIDDSWDNEFTVTRVYLEDAIEYALDGIDVDFPEIPLQGCPIRWK